MPIYNVEEYLKEALDSILNQSIGHRNLEVIMVNDCSTDKSGEIIDKYSSEYSNFKAIHLLENNGSPGKPRNVGIDNAKGEYLMFFDPDDYYTPDACQVLYDKISTENADIVSARFNYVFETHKSASTTPFGDLNEIELKITDDYKNLFYLGPRIWAKIYNKNLIENNNIRFIENAWAEDLEFNIHTVFHAKKIIHMNNYFAYNYRVINSENSSYTFTYSNENLLKNMDGYYATDYILKSHQKEEFFSVFDIHLPYWTNRFVLSDTSKTKKIEIIKKAAPLFKKYLESPYNLEPQYLSIFNNISEKRFNAVFLDGKSLAKYLEMYSTMEKQISALNKYSEEINAKNNLLEKKLKKYEKNIKKKKIQVANLQKTSGWIKYKHENIYERIRKKLNRFIKF